MNDMQIQTITASKIIAGKNDRKHFDEAKLEQLADSIKKDGLAQPPTIRPISDDEYSYEIVAGERRFRAMTSILGWTEIPAIVRELTDLEASSIMLAENVHRVDINPIEEANAYRKRKKEFGFTISEIAKQANVTAKRVDNRLKLLELSSAIQSAVGDGSYPLSFAVVLSILSSEHQKLAFRVSIEKKMTLNQFKILVGELHAEQATSPLFDMGLFTENVLKKVADTENKKRNIDLPYDESVPPIKKVKNIAISFENYIVNLLESENEYEKETLAPIMCSLYRDMQKQGLCFAPKTNRPLALWLSEQYEKEKEE